MQTLEVKAIMQTIKREKSDPQNQCKPKAGITAPFMRLIVGWMESSRAQESGMHSFIFWRDEVALLLGFYGLLRRSEIVALKVSDVQVNWQSSLGKEYIEINIRKSKTDQRGQGAMVCIPARSRHQIPIASIFKSWM